MNAGQLADLWQQVDLESLVTPLARKLLHEPGHWDPPAGILPSADPIAMSIGVPDPSTLPRTAFAEAMQAIALNSSDAAWAYGFGMGLPQLRALLAERISQTRGLAIDEHWIQLTNGSAGAIDLVCRSLINPGDVIITESPAYMGTLRNFRGVGADIRSVPMDADGMDMQALARLIEQLRAEGRIIKLIYTISTFSNPTGATLAPQRRQQLLALAARHGILILDDDAYGDLYFDAVPPASLLAMSGGHGVITVGSFSKVLATGLRVGWITASPALQALFANMRFAMGLNQMSVRVLAAFFANDQFNQHVASVRQLYRHKMTVIADALQASAGDLLSFTRPQGGFYLWLKLADGLPATEVWREAARLGVSLTRGANFFSEGAADDHIRLAFSWTPTERLEEGADRIARACRIVAGQ